MKFVYCGFDFFAECLATCLDQGHELVAAFSHEVDGKYNSNDLIRALSSRRGINLQIRKITIQDVQEFSALGCQFLISAAYTFRIPAVELDTAGIRAMNIHPTLLPEGRGPWPLPHIILKELTKTGVTIHKLAQEFDSGDILGQSTIDVSPRENLESLTCKLQMRAPQLLRAVVEDLNVKWENGAKQGIGNYWPVPTEYERTLDWCKPVMYLDKVVRAFGKFESYANFDNRDWLIEDASVWTESHEYTPGQVVHRTNREVVIAALDGYVCIRQFKPEPAK